MSPPRCRWPAARILQRLRLAGLVTCIGLVTTLAAREPLIVRVSPTLAQPPAFVVVRADVEAHEDNRSLEVSAEGDNFFTSSRVPLEGSQAPRFSEVHFDNLPAGAYKVIVVLMGSTGQRAAVTRTVLVGPSDDEPVR